MNLLAINEFTAVYSFETQTSSRSRWTPRGNPDAHELLKALLQAKSWKSFIAFLEMFGDYGMCCDETVKLDRASSYPNLDIPLFDYLNDWYVDNYNLLFDEIRPNHSLLKGHLGNAADAKEIALLDKSFLNDHEGETLGFLRLESLLRYRDFLDGLLKYAAICNGREDLFDCVQVETKKIPGSALVAYRFLPSFSREFSGGGYLDNLNEFEDVMGFEFPNDDPSSPDHAYDNRPLVSIAKPHRMPIAVVKKELCGRLVCGILNHTLMVSLKPRGEQKDHQREYLFSVDKGIVRKANDDSDDFQHDLDFLLYDYAVEQIANHNVSLCSICGTPVITAKSHGVEACYCSRSCVTIASGRRRDRAIALASAGKPLDAAIDDIGIEYAASVERWYKETLATNPAQ